jgi:uncharacterized membrane protein
MTGGLGGDTRGMASHIRSATTLVSRTALCAILATTAIVAAPHAARADLRYCNETGHEAQLSEGHANGGDGMTVKGTFVVRNGTCAVLVPGPLNVRRYYVHIDVNGYSIGSKRNMLCVFPMLHYEIAKQDRPGFACRGKAFPDDAVHIKGFVNVAMRLEPFVAIDTQGSKNVTLTQRSDYSIR